MPGQTDKSSRSTLGFQDESSSGHEGFFQKLQFEKVYQTAWCGLLTADCVQVYNYWNLQGDAEKLDPALAKKLFLAACVLLFFGLCNLLWATYYSCKWRWLKRITANKRKVKKLKRLKTASLEQDVRNKIETLREVANYIVMADFMFNELPKLVLLAILYLNGGFETEDMATKVTSACQALFGLFTSLAHLKEACSTGSSTQEKSLLHELLYRTCIADFVCGWLFILFIGLFCPVAGCKLPHVQVWIYIHMWVPLNGGEDVWAIDQTENIDDDAENKDGKDGSPDIVRMSERAARAHKTATIEMAKKRIEFSDQSSLQSSDTEPERRKKLDSPMDQKLARTRNQRKILEEECKIAEMKERLQQLKISEGLARLRLNATVHSEPLRRVAANIHPLYNMGHSAPTPFPLPTQSSSTRNSASRSSPDLPSWMCECGKENPPRFDHCVFCNLPRPAPTKVTWICQCGKENPMKFDCCMFCDGHRASGQGSKGFSVHNPFTPMAGETIREHVAGQPEIPKKRRSDVSPQGSAVWKGRPEIPRSSAYQPRGHHAKAKHSYDRKAWTPDGRSILAIPIANPTSFTLVSRELGSTGKRNSNSGPTRPDMSPVSGTIDTYKKKESVIVEISNTSDAAPGDQVERTQSDL